LYIRYVAFSHAEVNKLDMAIVINHHIVWFQISIDDVSLMQVFQRQENLRYVKSCLFFAQRLVLGAHQCLEITPWTKVENQEKFFLRLKSIIDFIDKWRLRANKDIPLSPDIAQPVITLLGRSFRQRFHRI
jgi:hypothetical protein